MHKTCYLGIIKNIRLKKVMDNKIKKNTWPLKKNVSNNEVQKSMRTSEVTNGYKLIIFGKFIHKNYLNKSNLRHKTILK